MSPITLASEVSYQTGRYRDISFMIIIISIICALYSHTQSVCSTYLYILHPTRTHFLLLLEIKKKKWNNKNTTIKASRHAHAKKFFHKTTLVTHSHLHTQKRMKSQNRRERKKPTEDNLAYFSSEKKKLQISSSWCFVREKQRRRRTVLHFLSYSSVGLLHVVVCCVHAGVQFESMNFHKSKINLPNERKR